MAKKLYQTDTLKQARSILIGWNQNDPTLTFGPLSAEDLSKEVAKVQALQNKIHSTKIDFCHFVMSVTPPASNPGARSREPDPPSRSSLVTTRRNMSSREVPVRVIESPTGEKNLQP